MYIEITHIDWDLPDETDENGLPMTAKDYGLPTWDEVVTFEPDLEGIDGENLSDIIADYLSDIYGFTASDFNWYMVFGEKE